MDEFLITRMRQSSQILLLFFVCKRISTEKSCSHDYVEMSLNNPPFVLNANTYIRTLNNKKFI